MTNGAPDNHEVEDSTELDYFNSLLKARKRYLRLWEYHNKTYKEFNRDQDKLLMDKYAKKHDKVDEQIEKLKEKGGYLDPTDLPQSAEGSDAE